MKSRKTYQSTLHDLRDMDPAKFTMPKVQREFAASEDSYEAGILLVVTSGIDGQTTSQPPHE